MVAIAAVLLTGGARAHAQAPAAAAHVSCSSKSGDGQQHCAADTSAGVALERSTGTGVCLLGRTWGYDSAGVWVSDGCSGEFVLGQTGAPSAAVASPAVDDDPSSYGAFDSSGSGFLIGRNKYGELFLGGYALVRYVNQLPADQTFTDTSATSVSSTRGTTSSSIAR
jgi:hypothetical protein